MEQLREEYLEYMPILVFGGLIILAVCLVAIFCQEFKCYKIRKKRLNDGEVIDLSGIKKGKDKHTT